MSYISQTRKLICCFIDVLMPSICTICGNIPIEHPSPVCPGCRTILLQTSRLSVTSSPHIDNIFSCCRYASIAKKCVKQFKYGKNYSMIYVLEELIRNKIDSDIFPLNTADIIVPVPLHRARLHKRGFNQSAIIADILADIFSVPHLSGNLIKIQNTVSQIGLTRNQRIYNLRGSFSVARPEIFNGKHVLLVDDVITTGATLDTCCGEMIKNGAKSVSGFTFAHTI